MSPAREAVFWGLVILADAVAIAAVLAFAVRRYSRQLAGALLETPLFVRLSEAHALTPGERRAILSMARRRGIQEPAVFFVSPSALDEGIRRLREEGSALAAEAGELPRKLHG